MDRRQGSGADEQTIPTCHEGQLLFCCGLPVQSVAMGAVMGEEEVRGFLGELEPTLDPLKHKPLADWSDADLGDVNKAFKRWQLKNHRDMCASMNARMNSLREAIPAARRARIAEKRREMLEEDERKEEEERRREEARKDEERRREEEERQKRRERVRR